MRSGAGLSWKSRFVPLHRFPKLTLGMIKHNMMSFGLEFYYLGRHGVGDTPKYLTHGEHAVLISAMNLVKYHPYLTGEPKYKFYAAMNNVPQIRCAGKNSSNKWHHVPGMFIFDYVLKVHQMLLYMANFPHLHPNRQTGVPQFNMELYTGYSATDGYNLKMSRTTMGEIALELLNNSLCVLNTANTKSTFVDGTDMSKFQTKIISDAKYHALYMASREDNSIKIADYTAISEMYDWKAEKEKVLLEMVRAVYSKEALDERSASSLFVDIGFDLDCSSRMFMFVMKANSMFESYKSTVHMLDDTELDEMIDNNEFCLLDKFESGDNDEDAVEAHNSFIKKVLKDCWKCNVLKYSTRGRTGRKTTGTVSRNREKIRTHAPKNRKENKDKSNYPMPSYFFVCCFCVCQDSELIC